MVKTQKNKRLSLEHRLQRGDPRQAVDLLAGLAGLPKGRIKAAMQKGAVWAERRGKKGRHRLRRAKAELRAGDRVFLFYDEQLLALEPPTARLVEDRKDYCVWYKPAGLIAQGTRFGDHCSLMRQVELWAAPRREVFLIHRLDREARGLMLFGLHKRAAARLSRLFQQRQVEKRYRVQLRGDLASAHGIEGEIDQPLDDKEARTLFRVADYDAEARVSTVEVRIVTGRLHQVRRHFAALGLPVVGDPKYGPGGDTQQGLRLVAHALRFTCPFAHSEARFALDDEAIGF